MSYRKRSLIILLLGISIASNIGHSQSSPGPVKAEIRKNGDQFQLYVNNKLFFIKGAGLESGSIEKLASHGANSFRTWRTETHRESGQAILDRAQANQLYVTMGLELGSEPHGFDYNDKTAVARQLEKIRGQVLKYKDHPALIIWAIGNELNLNATNANVWDAVNDISKMIHQVDPNHLTTTPLAGLNKQLVREIKNRAPDLDLLAIQMYADIENLPRYLRETGWDGPYIVTEWGATGHWEISKTAWGAPIENDSTTKARLYKKRYENIIAADPKQCLGSYAFLWGQKQERTPTWYGVFLSSGEETEAVDTLQYLWTGSWPDNRSPQIAGIRLEGKTAKQNIHLKPGTTYSAVITSSDPDGDSLTYLWEVMEENTAKTFGGAFESRPGTVPDLIENPHSDKVSMKSPTKPGAYRLFAYSYDGKGHAAHANVPFYVDEENAALSEKEKSSLSSDNIK